MAYTVVGDNKINPAVQIGVSETGVMAATIDGGDTWKETEGGTVENATTQGNTFNGANQLVKLDANAKLPAVDGSQLSGVYTLGDNPLLSGLEGLYRFDDNVRNVLDKNHGTITEATAGTVTYTTGKYGKAIGGFSSVANYVTAAISADTFTNAFTAAGWGYLNDGLNTSRCRILTIANGTTTVFSMTLDNHSTNKSAVYSGDTDTWLRTTSIPSVAAWHHIAATYANGVLKIYLDGILENQVTTNVAIQTATSLIIGQLWSNPDYKYANTANSLIDEVGLWNRALSATEIAGIYNSTKPIDLYETFADKTLMTTEQQTKLDNLLNVTGVGKGLSYDADTKTISTSSSGNSIEVTLANTFAVGNVVYKTSDGWALAKADTAATSEVVGIISAATTSAFTVNTSGAITLTAHGVSLGSIVYLSQETAGAFTTTEYTSGISLPIGVAVDANTILISIKRGINLTSDNMINTVNLITTNTTIYVATTGNDTTGNGTQANPYATITKALAYLQTFRILNSSITATIKLADGTYQIGNTINWSHMDSSRIWLEGNTSNNTAVKLYKTSGVDPIIGVYGKYVLRVRYIDFEGNGNKAALDGNTNVGVFAQSGAHVEVYNCIFNNFGHPAVYVIGYSTAMVSTSTVSNNYTGLFVNVMSWMWVSGVTYNNNTANTSPAPGTVGNANSYIYA